ncbi:hypothetical protein ACP4OV_002225 [Aristida adscensionis]
MAEAVDLRVAMSMLCSQRMEDRFRQLRASTLLAELRAAVSTVATVSSMGAALKLMSSVRSLGLATRLRELLEAVLNTEMGVAEQWHQVPAVMLRHRAFRSSTLRHLRQLLDKFRLLEPYAQAMQQAPGGSSYRYNIDARARNRYHAIRIQEPMVGRAELLEKMVSTLLVDRAGDGRLLVMPILGGPGIGKSRLAKALLHEDRVRNRFRVRLVVPVTHDFCLQRIYMMMLSPEMKAQAQSSPQAMASDIRAKLDGGDYLIVLDDVWSDGKDKWQEIGAVMKALPPNGRIVLTTRTPDIASKLATIVETVNTKPYYLQPLGKEFTSCFVARWTATYRSDWPAPLVAEAASKIAEKCSSVPLLLDYARRFFCQPVGMQFWQEFLGNTCNKSHPDIFWHELLAHIHLLPIDRFWQQFLRHSRELPDGDVVLESASVSYEHLPSDLQDCFSYCSVFPIQHDFDVEELADLLVAEGYIPSVVSKAQQKRFLKQLLDECFYPLQEHEHGDKAAYRMHKVLHIFAQIKHSPYSSVIRTDKGTRLTTKPTAQHTTYIRRASLIVDCSTASFPTSLFACNQLGTLILLQEGPMYAPDQPRCEITEITQELCQSISLIRALSFRATKIRMLPAKFPYHMKYLNLSQTDIDKIPSSISRMICLQTLILSHCNKLKTLHPNTTKLALLQKLDLEGCWNLVELPQDMRKMKNLEYLNVTGCSSLTQLPCGMGQLESLETFLGYVVSGNSGSLMSELQPLGNLHRLSLRSLEKVTDILDVRFASLDRKTKLESLSLRWSMDHYSNDTIPDYAVLESLQPHRHLKALEIVAYGGTMLPSWMTSLQALDITTAYEGITAAYEGMTLPSWMTSTKKLPYLISLVEIKLINLRSCERVFGPLGLLPCLKIAEISGAETVCSINDNSYGHEGTFRSLEKLTFSYMCNLEVWEQEHRTGMFPRLTELAIIQCPKLRALHVELPSLEKLTLWMNNKVLYDLKGALRGVAKSLEHMSISFSEELVASSDCEGLQDLDKLTKLEIYGCDELTCLPQGMKHLSSIRSLTIDNCSKLEALPDWLESLPSLQIMRLSCCPELHYIPQGLHQRPDIITYVEDCPNLQEEQIPNSPAQPSGKSVVARRNKGKEIVAEDD